MTSEADLTAALDAVFAYFCGYLMSRFAIHFSTSLHSEVDRSDALDAASYAFMVAALLSVITVVGQATELGVTLTLSIIFFSSFYPSLGTFTALRGYKFTAACLIALMVLATNAVASVPIADASLVGAMIGCLVSGVRYGSTNVGRNIFLGIVAGFFTAMVVTFVFAFILAFFVLTVGYVVFGIEFNVLSSIMASHFHRSFKTFSFVYGALAAQNN